MSEQPKLEEKPQTKGKGKPAQMSEKQIIDTILGNKPSVEEITVELHSKNKFYNLQDHGKPITIRPMTFEDERIMMSKKKVNLEWVGGTVRVIVKYA